MKLINGETLDGRRAPILKWALFGLLLITAIIIAIWLSTSSAMAVDGVIQPGCTGCHESQSLRDTPQTLDCGAGACHSTNNATQVSGSHATHLNATSGIGPDAMACDVCHGAGATTAEHDGHLNARINFIGADDVLSTTAVCGTCHSPGGGYNGVDTTGASVGAKDNWATGVYSGLNTLSLNKEKWCVGCHDDDGPTMNGRQAPSVGGDGSSYGFFESGHGLDSGSSYDGDLVGGGGGYSGADKECSDCHEFQYDHIDGTDGTGTSGANGQRLKATINGFGVSFVEDVCANCHSVDGEDINDSPAKASAHGNTDKNSPGGKNDYTKIESAYFSVKCQQCHDPHAGKLNDEGTRNLRMIRPDVVIYESTGTTGNVVFTNRGNDISPFPGTNSFDETDTEETDPSAIDLNKANNNDDICVTCHVNDDNPGSQMTLHAGGFGHGGPLDNRGKTCTNCHPHAYGGPLDTTYTLSDGFMQDESGSFCGSCHAAVMSTLSSGSHQTHFRYYYTKDNPVGNVVSLKGPGILICDVCHGIDSGALGGPLDESHHEGHRNGIKNFSETSETVLAQTNACDSCHSPDGAYDGVDTTGTSIGAKDNWAFGVYDDSRTITSGKEKWCVGCHDDSPSVITGVADNVDATDTPTTSMTAVNMAGDDTTYGAFASGHNKQSGSYDETTTMAGGSGNAAANKDCDTCHDLGVQHLNRSNDTSMAGQRITEVNGVSIAANASATAVCKACHQNAGGPDVAVNQVSDHGNTGEGYNSIESTMAAVGCDTCHEGHGLNENENGVRNLRMVRDAIEVTTTPPTTTSIVFERTAGTNSLDESDAVDSDDVCAACHSSGVNSGTPMVRHDGGDHTTADTSSIFYNFSDADKRNGQCTACHEHNYNDGEGGDIVTDANAFMPRASSGSCLAGEACHAATTVDQTSGSHETHFSGSAIGPSLLTCDACHGVGASPNGQHEGHSNGTVNFQENATSTLSNTSVCDTCHSSGGGYDGVDDTTAGAKSNWTSGVYIMPAGTTLTAGKEQWCVGCHDSEASDIGIKAPAVGGDASAYGYYVSGHGLDSGSNYDESSIGGGGGNDGASKECQKCHDLSSQHLDSLDGTGLVGQRVKTDINGNSGLTTVTEACQACHTYENAGGPDTASNAAKVSSHGNSLDGGYTPQIEGPFATNCAQCHELHGNNLNSSDTTRNLKMIRADILISETTGTTGNVVFTARTGTDSFDESDSTSTEDNDDICATCHQNSDNPGFPVVRHTGGSHDGPGALGSDQRGNDCTACHSHNYQEDTPTVVNDGFMPLGACGDCHPAVMNDPLFVTEGRGDTYGSHVTHFDYAQTSSNWSLKGPGITVCDVCHGLDAGNHVGHMNGVVNFRDGATTELVDTGACDTCHSDGGVFDGVTTGTPDVGAKGYWISGVYDDTATLTSGNELWCAGCHDDGLSEMLVGTPTVSTMTAANKIGDNATYGYYESGHGTTTTATYDDTTTGVNGGNDGAGKECAICHDLTTDHINTTNGTGTADQRILANINGQSVADIDDACKACHQYSGGPDDSTLTVSGHGNSGADGYSAIESVMTVPGCASCHELHGDNLSSGSRNLRMIRSDVVISESVGTTAAVDFKRVSGNDSFDADDGDDTDNICRVCHANENMQRNDGGDHTDTVAASIFYNALTPDKRGEDCTACHRHEYKSGDGTSDDAFMPGFYQAFDLDNTCDVTECHNATVANQTSGSHDTHFTGNNKGPSLSGCDTCHDTNATSGGQIGHDDTTITFSNETTIGATLACDTCHSDQGGYDGVDDTTIGAKNNWTGGVYVPAGTTLTAGKEQWCVGCHDSDPSNIVIDAPAVGGDDSAYGAYVSGHNKASGSYDATSTDGGNGNLAATLLCEDCHNLSENHLDSIDGTGTTSTNGQRIKANINSVAISNLFDACKACHGDYLGGATAKVSSHGNSEVNGYSRVETDTAVFTVECLQCHEPHGNNLVSASRNLMMIRSDVLISETTGTTAPIVFKSTTDANSGDGDVGNDSDDICAACHANSDNPGTPMKRHDGGDHYTTDSGSIFEGETTTVTNKLGEDCTDCHKHDYKDNLNVAEDDGFMPGLDLSAGCGGISGCHAATVFDQSSGSHATHFRYEDTSDTQSLKGPGIQTCQVCHPFDSDNGSHVGHINGVVNFLESSTTVLGATGACDSCHSPLGGYNGVSDTTYSVGAKANWADGAYTTTTTLSIGDEWCAGCHDSIPSEIFVAGTPGDTMTAPAAGGDASTYGAFVSGHNATTAVTYDSTTTGVAAGGNPGAGKACADCHDLGSQHLNTTPDTNTSGQRILDTINGQSGIVTIDGACKACHQNGEGTQVSGHGNDADEGYAAIEESPMAVPGCAACHELHGNNLASGSRNLRMIRNDVLISETTGTTAPVVFKRTSGSPDSFDSDDGDDTNDICVACHANSDNPGYQMQRNVGGNHTDTVAASIFFGAPNADKRGEDCIACHRHEFEPGDGTSDDAFMPAFYSTLEGTTTATCQVTDCHAATPASQTTGSHTTHFTGNKGPGLTDCDECHGQNASPNGAQSGHDDTTITFSNDTTIGATTACNICHSPNGGFNGVNDAVIGAKKNSNWADGVYMGGGTTLTAAKAQWCVGCHDNDPSKIYVTDTTMSAPDIGGDNTEYGFYISGHGLNGTYGGATTTNTTGGNAGADKRCESCHDLLEPHLNNINGTTTTGSNGQRIKDPINALTVSTVADVCFNCHQVTTGSPAIKKVSSHGNSQLDGYGPSIEDTFTVECGQCHDPHAAALNAEGRRNLRMVRPDVLISETTGTTGNVVFENTGDNATGTNSFDEKDIGETTSTGGNDDICTTCHVNSDNPGEPMVRHYGGLNHKDGSDKRGELCTSCHNHAGFGSVYAIVDGFMPAGCDSCHGFPPLAYLDATSQPVPPQENYAPGGGAHLRHQNTLNDPSIYAGENLCKRCHVDEAVGADDGGLHDADLDGVPKRKNMSINFYSPALGNSTTALGYSLTSIDNSSSTEATAVVDLVTTATVTSCQVGCHNPGVFKPLGETTQLMSNEATWTVRSIACVRCHDSQGAAIDATLSSTPIVQGVAQKSGHDRVDTSDATDPATGERLNRRDCLRCHYNETGVASDDGTHTGGTIVLRNLQVSTDTPFIWDETSGTVQAQLCLGCHDGNGMPTGWSFSESGDDPIDIETSFTTAAHRTGGSSSATISMGCVGNADIAGGYAGCHGSPHGSGKRKLLAPANAYGEDEQEVCLRCHNTTKIPTGKAGQIAEQMAYSFNSDQSYQVTNVGAVVTAVDNIFQSRDVGQWFKYKADFDYAWTKVLSVDSSTQVTLDQVYGGTDPGNGGTDRTSGTEFFMQAKRVTHPVGVQHGTHDTTSETVNGSFGWNKNGQRHVTCEDCHNEHEGEPGTSTVGLPEIGLANKGVWGVTPTYETVFATGGAVFTDGSSSVTSAALDGSGAFSWAGKEGWRIKNNYDKSGRWYSVVSINAGGLTLSEPFVGTTLTPTALNGQVIDYTMVKVTYAKTSAPTDQYELCLKCHSYFAYGQEIGAETGTDEQPFTPSGMYDSIGGEASVLETEIGADFAPTHLAYHPVMARGKNQPGTADQADLGGSSTSWPVYTRGTVDVTQNSPTITSNTATKWLDMDNDGSNKSTILSGWLIAIGTSGSHGPWYEVQSVDSNGQITLTTDYAESNASNQQYLLGAGLGNAFIPPFGPWAMVICSDCHRSGDPNNAKGPHGSNNKWQLLEATSSLTFDWWDGSSVVSVSPNNMNVNADNVVATPVIYCYNCHRRDVYGDIGLGTAEAPQPQLGRQPHDPTNTSHPFATGMGTDTRWGNDGVNGIICMKCHGGDTLGGIHGTSAGRSHFDENDAYVGTPIGANLRGERFLNGATWIGVTRATTADEVVCWTKTSADEVNSCAQGHGGSTAMDANKLANYNY